MLPELTAALQKMPARELLTLLTSKSADASTNVLEHLSQYRIFDSQIKGNWDGWTNANGKILLELIRQGTEQLQARVNALEKELSGAIRALREELEREKEKVRAG